MKEDTIYVCLLILCGVLFVLLCIFIWLQ